MIPFSFIRAAAGGAPFDPATLSLTSWLRAPYADPWAGVASAGSSGTNSYTGAPGNTPTAGTPLNGLATADFTSDWTSSADYAETCAPLTGYVLAALVNADSLTNSVAYPNGYDSAGLLSDGYGLSLGVDDSGVVLAHYDGGWKTSRSVFGIATSTWYFVQGRYDGTNIKVRVNGGAWSAGTAAGTRGIVATTYKLDAGRSTVSAYFDGRMAEAITSAALTDGELDDYRAYLNLEYLISI